MDPNTYRNRLRILEDILNEAAFLLRNNEFPIHQLNSEILPEDIPLLFQPAQVSAFSSSETILDSQGEILAVENYLTRNFSCRRCPDRDRGIRGFLIRGRKKLLILHYSGNTSGQNAIFKRSNRIIFRSSEIQSCFQELLESALQTNFEEFYYQEYPGCHFTKNSSQNDWKRRVAACDVHVLETIQKENVKAILILGSSAVLKWDKDFCSRNQGKVMQWNFSEAIEIPYMITRSPEALVYAKQISDEKYNEIFQDMKRHILTLSEAVKGFE